MIKCFTLAYSLCDDIDNVVRKLYEQNKCEFSHLIIDLGFPLEYGADIPEDIGVAKQANSIRLQKIADKYGSEYVRMENLGVSQNWTQAMNYLHVTDEDILVGVEPDEVPQQDGWLQAMADVLKGDIVLCSLVAEGQYEWLQATKGVWAHRIINEHNCAVVHGPTSMGLIGYTGKFLREIQGVPVPKEMGIYGSLEWASYGMVEKLGYKWCFLMDYGITHTENAPLYRAWKSDVVHGDYAGAKQIHFDKWLEIKRNG